MSISFWGGWFSIKCGFVSLVGRPNVGKSTLFNRLVGTKIAIIDDVPGITRYRIYGDVKFGNYNFHLIDTGGIDISNESFNNEIKIQAEIAISEADVIVFVVDGKEGITTNDLVVKDMLLKSGKKIVVWGISTLWDDVIQSSLYFLDLLLAMTE